MPVSYQQNKIHILKWRENHKEQYNEYMSKKSLERYNNNRDVINDRRKELYNERKNDPFYLECKRFRRILF